MQTKFRCALIALFITVATLFMGVAKAETSPRPVNIWAIDMTPLEVDGKLYAIWSGWRDNFEHCDDPRDQRGQHLFIAEMKLQDEKPLVSLGDRVALTSYDTYEWENEVKHNIMEGPQILHNPKTDDIYVVYSVNGSWTSRYKLGGMKLTKGEDPLNPASWVKYDTPLFDGVTKEDGLGYMVYGVGHASFTTSPDDKETWIYYHAKTSPKGGWVDRRAYLQKISFDKDGKPQMGTPKPLQNKMDRPSGETKIDKKLYGIKSPEKEFENPIEPDHQHADPWVTKHNGLYYTVRFGEGKAWVTESPYLSRYVDKDGNSISWREARVDCGWRAPAMESGAWNPTQYWAPEIHNINNRWYIFYAAGINTKGPFWAQRAGVLVSTTESIFGPYVEHDDKPLFTGEREYVLPTTNHSL